MGFVRRCRVNVRINEYDDDICDDVDDEDYYDNDADDDD